MRRAVLPERRLTGSHAPRRACGRLLNDRPARLAPGAVLLASLAGAGPACAHNLSNRFGDFYGGLLHPATALEHALPLLALGLLAGQQGPRAARWLLLVLPLALLVGAALATVAPALPWVSPINLLSFALLGGLVAAAWPLPLLAVVALAALFGLSHGYENGRAMTADVAPHLFVPGVALAGFMAAALVSATTLALTARAAWLHIGVRIAGSWIAAIGIMMIDLA